MRAPLFNPSYSKAGTLNLLEYEGSVCYDIKGVGVGSDDPTTGLWVSVVSALNRVSGEGVVVFCTFASAIIDRIKDVCSAQLGPVNIVE